jgi:CheY-like chemotaxis protein
MATRVHVTGLRLIYDGIVEMERRGHTSDLDSPLAGASGVRPCLKHVRILVIEPDAAERDRLARAARDAEVPLLVASSPTTALALRAQCAVDLVACALEMRGAEELVRTLRRERFPVLVITVDSTRAIAAFGLDVPVLERPVQLAAILDQASELVAPA